MKDVARHANVSIATVSRVLRDQPNVRPEVREHVLRVVDELGYRRNRVASSLRTRTSGVIGLLVSDIRNPFFTDLARAVEDVAHEHEMSVFLCNTDEDPAKETKYLNTLLDENAAGIILSPTPSPAKHFRTIVESNIPIVMIDRYIEGIATDHVLSDNVQAAYTLTTHLIDQGCKRIGAVIGMSASTTGHERMAGYRQGIAAHGLESLEEFVLPHEDAGAAVVSRWLQLDTPPDALLMGNVRLTIGALNAIKQSGLQIPHDVLLAGFDETSWMQHVGPGITVISQPIYEMGRSAVELLLQRMADHTRPARELILKGQMIVRGSTVNFDNTPRIFNSVDEAHE